MTVSVVIPCHNSGPWIAEALTSVMDQTLQPCETIVVDDASTDASADIVRATMPDAITVAGSWRNAAAARNAGIRKATGDWVAFLDADNRWHPDHLEKAQSLLSGSDDVAYKASGSVSARYDGISRKDPAYPIQDDANGLTAQDFITWRRRSLVDKRNLHVYAFAPTGFVICRSRLIEIGGFDESQKRRHDFELFMRAVAGHSWCTTSLATWWVRPIRPGDISHHSNQPECAYYALRAYHLNRSAYASDLYAEILSTHARIAVRSALCAGHTDSIRRTAELAWPYLPQCDKLILGASLLMPGSLRSALHTIVRPAYRAFRRNEVGAQWEQ